MPVTINHALTATTPDDAAYEIRPQAHWNATHAVTLNISATEISGLFSNANGVSFGLSNNSITASIAPGGAPGSVSAGTTNFGLGEVVFSNSNGVTFGLNGATVTATVKTDYQTSGAYLTTAAVSNHSHGASANNGSFGFQTLSFSNANGVTFATSAGPAIVASVVTAYRNNTDAIGLNTAQSNVTWTVNSSGLSFDARGYAGTGTSATNASVTLNSNGLAISVAAPGGGGTVNFTASSNTTLTSTGTWDASQLKIRGAGVISVGFSNGEVVLSANAAAGDGYNIVSMLTSTSGGGTLGATFSNSAASIGLMAGSNITLSQTSNTINIVAPNSSSLVAFQGLTLSTNGSTISVGEIQASFFRQAGQITQAGTVQGNSLVSIQPFVLARDVVFSNAMVAGSWNVTTAANNSSAYQDVSLSAVIYSRNVSTLSYVTSLSNTLTRTWSSNASQTVTGVVAMSASLAAAATLTEGEYWIAFHVSTANSATGGANTTALGNALSMILSGSIGSAANVAKAWGGQTATSQALFGGQGILSTGATRSSIAFSDLPVNGVSGHLAPIFFELRNGTYQL